MTKTVYVKPDLTPEAFGCEKKYFERHINKRPLTLIWMMKEMAGVKDEEGEEWTISKSLLMDTPNYRTIGEELTTGHRQSA